MSQLNKKIALVTGGSRGIGAEIVRQLAADGAEVYFTFSSSSDLAARLSEEVEAKGGKAISYELNAAQPETMEAFAKHFVKTHGAPDILVHNAGVFTMGEIGELSHEEYSKVMRINVESIFALTNAIVSDMVAGSRIIVTSSVLGERASAPGLSIYNASKFAATGLARSWAKDLGAKGILVNAVQPGPINTDMNPDSPENDGAEPMKSFTALGRYGRPEEVAHVVRFLAGPGATYITGATINVDGGWNA